MLRRMFLLVAFIVSAMGLTAFYVDLFQPTLTETRGHAVDLMSLRWEIAATDELRRRGLSERDHLDSGAGMIFVFDKPGIYPFWMEGMLIPLDIIWLRDGRVVEMATLAPPLATNGVIKTHVPFHSADKVLELNAGEARQRGIIDGSRVLLP